MVSDVLSAITLVDPCYIPNMVIEYKDYPYIKNLEPYDLGEEISANHEQRVAHIG